MATEHRIVKVPVSDTLIVEMMRKGWRAQLVECMDGLPPDAEFLGTTEYHEAIYFVFSHPSFAEVAFGEIAPSVKPVFRKYSYPQVDELLTKCISEDQFPMGQLAVPHG